MFKRGQRGEVYLKNKEDVTVYCYGLDQYGEGYHRADKEWRVRIEKAIEEVKNLIHSLNNQLSGAINTQRKQDLLTKKLKHEIEKKVLISLLKED
ncbi:hypothetical protein LCGC14_2406700 [marine sediment metagenome]|uniref:Uncharacterized protein n=1 Tax=marine sediment metagenome TaxID=412755 RepID=A0A0F9BTK9_9ZZZZ